MKNLIFTSIFCFVALFLSAQDYSITFSATGESNTVSAVTVENLTQNKSLTLNGNDILRLKGTVTSISDLDYNRTEGIQIYPNPMEDFSLIEFTMRKEGSAKIELLDILGRKLIETQNYLNAGRHSYRINGIVTGMYVLKVNAGGNLFSEKLMSNSNNTSEMLNLTYQNTIPLNDNIGSTKSTNSEIQMQYNSGDVLKFNAKGGVHLSVVVQIITQSKNIEFPFYKCTDPDNRNYATIKMGNQVWMAENFAYLPSISSDASISNSLPYYYVYGNTLKTVSGAKSLDNYKTYGVLYNWTAAKAVKPTGWHLPSITELEAFENYLKNNGFSDGSSIFGGSYIAKSIAATTKWSSSSISKSVGNNLLSNNKSGFSALPGGQLDNEGVFHSIGSNGYWWSSSEHSLITNIASYYMLGFDYTFDFNKLSVFKSYGFSVRYVKD